MSKQSRENSRTERAAAIRAAQQRKERNRRLALIVGIVAVLGAIIAGGAWYGAGDSPDPVRDTTAVVAAGDGSITVGPDDADVKIVVYEDFQCPYCRQLEEETRDFLRQNAEAGKVQVEYRPVNLLASLPYSERGMNAFAAALRHGNPKDALRVHDLLFENQPYESASASMSADDIEELVAEAGADDPAVLAALGTRDEAFFDAAARAMADQGIQGTPTVFVDGKAITGSVPDLVAAIEKAVDAS